MADPMFIVDSKNMEYEVVQKVGRGAYGVVVSAKDKKKGTKVAIKKVHNAFEDLIDAKSHRCREVLKWIFIFIFKYFKQIFNIFKIDWYWYELYHVSFCEV